MCHFKMLSSHLGLKLYICKQITAGKDKKNYQQHAHWYLLNHANHNVCVFICTYINLYLAIMEEYPK